MTSTDHRTLLGPATGAQLLDRAIAVGRKLDDKLTALTEPRPSFGEHPERYIWLFTRPCLCIVATLAGQAAPTAERATARMIEFGLEHEEDWYRQCTVTLVLKAAAQQDKALWPVGCPHRPLVVAPC